MINILFVAFFLSFFQEKLESGSFLQDKVKECFKDNPHCLTLVMNPDVCLCGSLIKFNFRFDYGNTVHIWNKENTNQTILKSF